MQEHAIAPDVRDAIVAYIRAGDTNSEIMARTGVSGYAIKQVAREAGIYRGAKGKILSKEEFDDYNARKVASLQAGRGKAPAVKASSPAQAKRAVEIMRGLPTRTTEDGTESHDELAPLSEDEGSNSIKLLRFIAKEGPFLNEGELTQRLHAVPEIKLGGHTMSHVLHDLLRRNQIEARHSENAAAGQRLRRIEVTVSGRNTIRTHDAPRQNHKEAPEEEPRASAPTNGSIRDVNPFTEEGRAIMDTLVAEGTATTLAAYPTIAALLRRESKIHEAARALEDAGLVDLGLAALAQIDNLLPLEREVLAFVKAR